MIVLLRRLFGLSEPVLSEARPRDAAALAALHATAFNRGWSEGEFHRLLIDPQVLCHRATRGRRLLGFVLSRNAAGEAEILSIAVAARARGRGLGRKLVDLHLRRLAGRGSRTVFLEVGENNEAARRLYRAAGFREVGRRESYYSTGARASGAAGSAALVLRRDLA